MSIQNFIQQLEHVNKNPKNLIRNYTTLINALNKLDSMIGMEKVKESVISQIQYYLINKYKNIQSLDSHMFHTVVSGPPGCGKTTLVEILAEIWISLGLINKEKGNETQKISKTIELNKLLAENTLLTLQNLSSKSKLDKIKKDIITDKNKLFNVIKQLNIINYKFNDGEITKVTRSLKSINSSMNKNIKTAFDTGNTVIENVIDLDYEPNSQEENLINTEDMIIKFKRNDLIGKYVGHTAIKTREALMKGLNKVIFIDEAYELYNSAEGSGDSFGMECLNTILNFMNEFSDKCIIVFAGYKDLLKDTIFKVQPGLERRIAWTYEIEDYKMEELVKIYEKQLKDKKWELIEKSKIIELFKQNKELFKFGGGDTLRLCLYTKIVYSEKSFNKLINDMTFDSIIDFNIVKNAVEMLKNNHQNKKEELPFGMYI